KRKSPGPPRLSQTDNAHPLKKHNFNTASSRLDCITTNINSKHVSCSVNSPYGTRGLYQLQKKRQGFSRPDMRGAGAAVLPRKCPVARRVGSQFRLGHGSSG